MGVNTKIIDGGGSSRAAAVDKGNILRVTNANIPSVVTDPRIPFAQFLTDDGISTGSNDLMVDGSVTPQEFFIVTNVIADRYITTLSFVIADAGAVMNKFGNIAALTNGCKLFYERSAGETVIRDELKSNFDFLSLAHFQPSLVMATGLLRQITLSAPVKVTFLLLIYLRISQVGLSWKQELHRDWLLRSMTM